MERCLLKRKTYLKQWYKLKASGKQFVYVDESGFAPTAERQFGYAPKGKRVYGLRSGHKRPRQSLIAATCNGFVMAPMLFDGSCNATVFNAWLETQLVQQLTPSHVVVMDNATFHKSLKTKELIEATGATLLFLPPYSPDLNPIEKLFANIKRTRTYDHKQSIEQAINKSSNYLCR